MTAPAVTGTGRPPYERSTPVLSFTVPGIPQPQGSKAFKGISRSGRAIMVESAKGLKPWRTTCHTVIMAAVQRAGIRPAGGYPLLGPVAVDLVFTMPKPKSAPKTRLTWPVVKPDIDKIVRALLDSAKTAGLYVDDSQVVDVHAWKVYPSEAPGALSRPGVTATVYLIGRTATTIRSAEQPALELS